MIDYARPGEADCCSVLMVELSGYQKIKDERGYATAVILGLDPRI